MSEQKLYNRSYISGGGENFMVRQESIYKTNEQTAPQERERQLY